MGSVVGLPWMDVLGQAAQGLSVRRDYPVRHRGSDVLCCAITIARRAAGDDGKLPA